jgi:Tol biopolymer transport system component
VPWIKSALCITAGAGSKRLYTRAMKGIRGGLLLAVALLLLALSPAISWATYPGTNGRIAYDFYGGYSDPNGIYTVLPDGSGAQQLTDGGGNPSWSADGRLIAFIRSDGEAAQVWTMRADGTHERQVTHDGVEDKAKPGFSPSGRRIVYTTGSYYGGGSIFKVRPDGTKKRRIVGPIDGSFPTTAVFSPGGRRIAFEGAPKGRGQGIWKVKPDGSHLRRLTMPPGRYAYDLLDWSPDGRHIVFYRCQWGIHECDGADWIMWADGSVERPLARTFGEVYSPKGYRSAFAGGDYDNVSHSYNCLDIYTIRLNGSDRRQLTNNCADWSSADYASDPSWQPIPQP